MFIVIYNNTVHVSNLLVYILLFHFTVLGPVLSTLQHLSIHTTHQHHSPIIQRHWHYILIIPTAQECSIDHLSSAPLYDAAQYDWLSLNTWRVTIVMSQILEYTKKLTKKSREKNRKIILGSEFSEAKNEPIFG